MTEVIFIVFLLKDISHAKLYPLAGVDMTAAEILMHRNVPGCTERQVAVVPIEPNGTKFAKTTCVRQINAAIAIFGSPFVGDTHRWQPAALACFCPVEKAAINIQAIAKTVFGTVFPTETQQHIRIQPPIGITQGITGRTEPIEGAGTGLHVGINLLLYQFRIELAGREFYATTEIESLAPFFVGAPGLLQQVIIGQQYGIAQTVPGKPVGARLLSKKIDGQHREQLQPLHGVKTPPKFEAMKTFVAERTVVVARFETPVIPTRPNNVPLILR